VTDDASYGALLLYFTGSQRHGVRLRERAQKMGLSLNEYGLTTLATGKLEQFDTEEAIYSRLDLPYIAPELREDGGEIEAAERRELPQLVDLADLRGDLHSHTDWTDGRAPLEEMARAAHSHGRQYIAVTDHSQSQTVSGGLNVERLREHTAAVRRADAASQGIRLLAGTEMDILADGSLDYPDAALAELDIVLGSIHGAMDQDRDTMTRRVTRAMASPHLDIVAHLTTRLIGRRAPVEIDLEAVFRAAAQTGTVLEINASPPRLDLKDTHIRMARDLGVVFAINTDAHRPEEFGWMRYGVLQARRGWCEGWRVINTLPFDDLSAFLAAPKAERYDRISRRG
jgi:DNA polymerase (family X)